MIGDVCIYNRRPEIYYEKRYELVIVKAKRMENCLVQQFLKIFVMFYGMNLTCLVVFGIKIYENEF